MSARSSTNRSKCCHDESMRCGEYGGSVLLEQKPRAIRSLKLFFNVLSILLFVSQRITCKHLINVAGHVFKPPHKTLD